MGYGNTITNDGTIHSVNGAALWFQDDETDPLSLTTNRNHVINNGTISTGKGNQYNVFGSSKGSGGPGLWFENYGSVVGSLSFGNGNDTLYLGTGSSVTGNINGGGGNNDLTLHAQNTLDHSILGGAVQNFETITKTGAGSWLIMGQVPATDPNDPNPNSPVKGSLAHIKQITVVGGTLALLGANPNFVGKVDIQTGGTLNVQAQGISNAIDFDATNGIKNDGTLVFDQPFNDTFAKKINGAGTVVKEGNGTLTLTSTDNTYAGGTEILQGTIAINDVRALGAATGNITLGSPTISGYNTSGTLQLNADVTLANTRDVILDDGGGTIDTQGNTVTVDSKITGSGDLAKAGGGILVVTNQTNDNTGDVNVGAGTLRVLGVLGTAGSTTTTIYQGTTLDGWGTTATTGVVRGDVVNMGTIAPGISGDGAANANAGRYLTIDGDYKTAGGPPSYVKIDSILGDIDGTKGDNSPTTKLVINGSASGPFTWVNVTNYGGIGHDTATGIEVIETTGSTADSFRLKATAFLPDGTPVVVAGDWGYKLVKDGNGGTTDHWYLVAAEHNGQLITPPNVTVFDSVAAAAAPFNLIGTLTQRVGNRSWAGFGQHRQYIGGASPSSDSAYASPVSSDRRFAEGAGMWTRIEGAKASIAPRKSDSHRGKSDVDFWRAELGFDVPLWRPTAGSALIFGLSGHFAGVKSEMKKMALAGSRGKIDSDGHGFGATLTWYGEYGFYVDAVAKWTWYESDMKATHQGVVSRQNDNKGLGQVYSLEVGKTFNLGTKGLSITPQVQYVHNAIQTDSFYDEHGEKFSYKNSVGKLLRMGVGLNREWSYNSASGDRRRFELYGVGNVYHEFDGKTQMKHDMRPNQNRVDIYRSEAEKWWAGGSVRATYDWCDSRYSVYAEAGYRTTLRRSGDNHILHGEAGFRFNF